MRNLLAMRARFGFGGWVGIDGVGLSGPLYVRVRESDGRLRVAEMYFDQSRGEPFDQQVLRSLPLTLIDTLINAHADEVRRGLHEPAPDLSLLAAFFDTKFVNWTPDSRNWIELCFAAQAPEDFRNHGADPLPRPRRPRKAWRFELDEGFKLTKKSPAGGLTDAFLRDVAKAYAAAVARGERPNRAMAEQTGYDIKSAQRWVYTARNRGIMPRGSQGRVG